MRKSGNLLYDVLVVIGIAVVLYFIFKLIFHILFSSLFWIILIGIIVAYFFFRYSGKRRI